MYSKKVAILQLIMHVAVLVYIHKVQVENVNKLLKELRMCCIVDFPTLKVFAFSPRTSK